ncbi:MAG: SIS domain-containing protein, partial [Acidobacteria bacterium]|nr:SIS domain-containing protein [Acidobacteriota bacterium]
MADAPGALSPVALAKREAHVVRALREAAAAHERMTAGVEPVVRAAQAMAAALKQGRTVFAFGNGGSAADAQHFTAELVGRYEQERRGWPAVALSTDT